MKYRKLPVVIEAVQLKVDNLGELAAFCPTARIALVEGERAVRAFIPTLEGEMLGTEGDFIIRGVNGEFYPCKPDIFWKTYEIVS